MLNDAAATFLCCGTATAGIKFLWPVWWYQQAVLRTSIIREPDEVGLDKLWIALLAHTLSGCLRAELMQALRLTLQRKLRMHLQNAFNPSETELPGSSQTTLSVGILQTALEV